MKAGFAEIDITPPLGAHKIGWIKDLIIDTILDPLAAHLAVFVNDAGERLAFVQLDTLSIRWTTTTEMRRRIAAKYGFPGDRIMVSATHNHCGPAVANCGDVPRDDAYLEGLIGKVVTAFGQALANLADVELGFAHVFEYGLSHNRRVMMRDGTTKTHGSINDPGVLAIEGPIDPEVGVLAARGSDGRLRGCLVNFTCHPTHHGGGGAITAGYPGVLAREMKARGCPVTLFLNGASGNISSGTHLGTGHGMGHMGETLANVVERIWGKITYGRDWKLGAATTTLQLPFRRPSEAETQGKIVGAQRFVDPTAYDRGMPGLLKRMAERQTQPAELQVLFLGDLAYAGVPAEYFVEHALRIKEQTHPRHAIVVGQTNGMVGYVPTKAAFTRGGYETTFAPSSRLAPEAGDLMADAIIALMRNQPEAK